MRRLILKFKVHGSRNPLPKIEEMTGRLGLRIEKVEESRPGHKEIAITGQLDKLHDMDKELVRFASITRKVK